MSSIVSIGEKLNGYTIGRLLGKGSYGTVHLVRNKENNEYAMKTIIIKRDEKEKLTERICNEIDILSKVLHQNIVKVVEKIQQLDQNYYVMDYYPGGDLFRYVLNERLSERQVKKYFIQLLSAVEHIHDSGFIHRDIKLENILLSKDKQTIYLGDFGFATNYQQDIYQNEFYGSIHYCSPEICQCIPYIGPEVDIWSLGVCLYAMLFGILPFTGDDQFSIYCKIKECSYIIPSSISKECFSLLKSLLHPNITTRIDIKGIKNHPWIINPNNENITSHEYISCTKSDYPQSNVSCSFDTKKNHTIKKHHSEPQLLNEYFTTSHSSRANIRRSIRGSYINSMSQSLKSIPEETPTNTGQEVTIYS